jgi:hypothetical protein
MIIMTDFWGNEIKEQEPIRSKYQAWKKEHNFKKASNADISCRTCNHCCRSEYHNKNYYKCELLGISHGPATDIRLSNLCDLWEE